MIGRKQLERDLKDLHASAGAGVPVNDVGIIGQACYVPIVPGVFSPNHKKEDLERDIAQLYRKHRFDVLNDNTVEAIIMHEFACCEVQYSEDIEQTVAAVSMYGINREQVENLLPVFIEKCELCEGL